jgi:hypothetical protein
VKLRARYGSGTVKAQRQGAYGVETDMADMAQLKEDGWHAEANDDFPMTLADRRDSVFRCSKTSPPRSSRRLSIIDPLNIEEIFELIQVPGFESSHRDQKRRPSTRFSNFCRSSRYPASLVRTDNQDRLSLHSARSVRQSQRCGDRGRCLDGLEDRAAGEGAESGRLCERRSLSSGAPADGATA